MSRKLFAGVCLLALCIALPMAAQESRGAITGRVSDTSGGMIPGASVVVTNTATNEARRLTTNETGYYEANFLEPGAYAVAVESGGFKRSVRSGITVNVSTRLEINVTLEVGGVAETIEVTAEAPLLDTTSASGGRVLDSNAIVNLPFSDLNPFALTALAPGMQWTGQPEYRRPFDNGGTSAFNTMGGVGQNEYTIDGMTVTGTGRRVGFTPPADSVTEFKIETSNFDASQGFTSGASINVSSKSGTNRFTGSLFNQHWQQRWNATGHFQRTLWEDRVRSGAISPDTQKQATGRSNTYGFSASGPVFIPKLLNLKDKVFWTLTWNGIRQSKAESTSSVNRTVATAAMKQGDFSELWLAPNGVQRFTVYDPRSAVLDGNTVRRTPFPGNRGVPILNPMYQTYAAFYPTPNNTPGLVTPEGFNNYLAFGMPKDEIFDAIVNRYDYIINDKHRVNVRWQWNDRLADEYDWTYETVKGLHSNGLTRINKGGNVNWLWTMNSTNILDVNFGVSRFDEGSRNLARTAYRPADVGLPAYVDARAGDFPVLPYVDFNDLNDVSGSYPVVGSNGLTSELRLGMTTIKGAHSFKYGWQERAHKWTALGPGNTGGSYQFRNNWTRATNVDNVSNQHGLDWAAFMMGLPTNIGIDTNDSFLFFNPRRALYIQDDWRVTSKLRLQLGLRYEGEGGISERHNRGIAAPFLFDLEQPFTPFARAAYAANPIPELPASQFNPVGGTAYLGTQGFDTATKGHHFLLPKIGIVYSFDNKTVVRAGYGMYADTLNVNNNRPDTFGYNQATTTPVTNDAGLNFCCGVGTIANLANGRTPIHDPFPVRADGTRFDEPLQSALGGLPRVGRGFGGGLPWNYRPALQQRWRVGVQRELMRNTMLDVSYNGAYSTVPVQQRIDFLPQDQWTTGMLRDQANDNRLNANVTNPFRITNMASLQQSNPLIYRYMAGQNIFTNAVIARHNLIRPHGFMGNVQGLRNGVEFSNSLGYVDYHDIQVLIERRYTKGLTTNFMYTGAVGTEANFYLNEFDSGPSERISNNVRPHRIAWTTIYELPFGKGRTFLKDGASAWLLGNWNVSWVYQRQGGPATNWGNRFFHGDINNIGDLFNSAETRSRDLRQWFDPSIAFRGTGAIPSGFQGFEGRANQQPGSYHVRTFPVRLEQLREDGIRNWDIKIERIFPIVPEKGIQARFSLDMLNATNHTNFGGPNLDPASGNFGRVTSQRGLPRALQFNLRVDF
jgi:hypothetical protein